MDKGAFPGLLFPEVLKKDPFLSGEDSIPIAPLNSSFPISVMTSTH